MFSSNAKQSMLNIDKKKTSITYLGFDRCSGWVSSRNKDKYPAVIRDKKSHETLVNNRAIWYGKNLHVPSAARHQASTAKYGRLWWHGWPQNGPGRRSRPPPMSRLDRPFFQAGIKRLWLISLRRTSPSEKHSSLQYNCVKLTGSSRGMREPVQHPWGVKNGERLVTFNTALHAKGAFGDNGNGNSGCRADVGDVKTGCGITPSCFPALGLASKWTRKIGVVCTVGLNVSPCVPNELLCDFPFFENKKKWWYFAVLFQRLIEKLNKTKLTPWFEIFFAIKMGWKLTPG